MALPGLDAAASRHLEDVAVDIAGLLGPGVELDQLAIEPEGPATVTIRARYRMAGVAGESTGRGENVVEAHARLRAAVVEDRIGLGLRALV
jgi:hypothetical protein